MGNIFGVLAGTAKLSDVARIAALDVLVVVAMAVVAMLASSLLQAVTKGVIALVAGSASADLIEGYLTYPGVVFHELSHALFATISGAKVTGISLSRTPLADGSGYVLGSVTFVTRGNRVLRSFQLALTGVAPLITGLAAMYLMLRYAFPACTKPWHWAVWGYLFLCVLLHTELSGTDLTRILEGLPIILLILFVVFLVCPRDPATMVRTIAGWFSRGGSEGS